MPLQTKLAAGFASIAFSVMMLAFAVAPVLNAATASSSTFA